MACLQTSIQSDWQLLGIDDWSVRSAENQNAVISEPTDDLKVGTMEKDCIAVCKSLTHSVQEVYAEGNELSEWKSLYFYQILFVCNL